MHELSDSPRATRNALNHLRRICFLALVGLVLETIWTPSASAQTSVLSTLHVFTGATGDGAYSSGALVMDAAGNLYGTTQQGGAYNAGVVFELVKTPVAYSERVLYNFTGGSDGGSPYDGLIVDAQGNLYGTTYQGGTAGVGTVFELVNNAGNYTETVLYSFSNSGGDGQNPQGGVIRDSNGNLFGTTLDGGTVGVGTVFELVNSGGSYTEKVLYNFAAGSDGKFPYAGLVMDPAGSLYGTTADGGTTGKGTVFKLVNSGGSYTEQVLHTFTGVSGDGSFPYADLIIDSSGNLFGTTSSGGTGNGVVLELVNNSGTYSEQILYAFAGSGDGASPSARLIADPSGNLYGTTSNGGKNNVGTVFELINNSGNYTERVLHSFANSNTDGGYPYAGLILDPVSGSVYGTTNEAGSYFGTVFSVATFPSGSVFSTTTTLSSSQNPVSAGDLTFTAGVATSLSGLLATGSVTLMNGSSVLGSATLSSGTASITVDSTAVGIGSYTVTAQYTPDVAYLSASSGSISQTVTENGVVVTNGNNTLNGNQTVNGSVTATTFSGNGGGLTNVTAAGLVCQGCVGNFQLGVNYAGSPSQGGAANNALLFGGLPPSAFQPAGSYATLGGNTFAGDQTITGNLTATGALSAAKLSLPPTGTATAAQGFNSGTLDQVASGFSSSTNAAQNLTFRWQAEPVPSSNNTANPLATLNLLYGVNGSATETGLSVNPDGTINFASGQTFPASGGGGGPGGTITGVTAGPGLTGGGTTGTVTISLASNACAPGSALTALPFTCNPFAGNGANNFTGNQTVAGTVTATAFSGNGAGLTNVNALTAVTAATATNALALGGNPPSYYATTGANTFTGNQNMPEADVSGAVTAGSITIGGGTAITEYVSLTASITIPALSSGSCSTLTTAPVTGFTPGNVDSFAIGTSSALMTGLGGQVYLTFQAWETTTTASPTLTIQMCNAGGSHYKGGNTGTIRIDIFKH